MYEQQLQKTGGFADMTARRLQPSDEYRATSIAGIRRPAAQHPLLGLQRAAGNSAVAALLARGRRATVPVQRAVDTAGGMWDTTEYSAMSMPPQKQHSDIGASIRLEFVPNGFVDSSKIALIQTVTSKRDQTPLSHPSNPSVKQGPHQGARIDNDQFAHSPIYAEDAFAVTDAYMMNPHMSAAEMKKDTALEEVRNVSSLKKVKADPQTGGYGSTATSPPTKAWLRDIPIMQNVTKEASASNVFEVTAVSLTGSQKDVYYGTIRWGWRKPADQEQVDLIDLEVVSYAGMSDLVRSAAEVWNDQENRNPFTKDPRLKLVVPQPGVNDLVDRASIDGAQIKARLKALQKAFPAYRGWLSSRAASVNVAKRNADFELLYLAKLLQELETKTPPALSRPRVSR